MVRTLAVAFGGVFGFLVHRELIGPFGLVLVDAALHVPAGEVAAVGAGEGARAEAAYRGALLVAVVDVAGVEGGLFCAGVIERGADGALPCGFGDVVACAGSRC